MESEAKRPSSDKMLWSEGKRWIEVRDPQDNSLVEKVPALDRKEVQRAIEAARNASRTLSCCTTFQRSDILQQAADNVQRRGEEFAVTIAREGSKTIREARKEVRRCTETLRLSAEEAKRINGETLSFDQAVGGEGRVGYYYRFPLGLIAAITPFNDPLNLVAHKVGPAIASGNAILIKPSSLTPLSALKLRDVLIESGLPEDTCKVVTGYGDEVGSTLTGHPDVRMISFTGGIEAGEAIRRKAGLKKINMELGSNSPVIVCADAHIKEAADACVSGSFWAAGQNCLGVQRIYIENNVYEEFVHHFLSRVNQYRIGNKMSEDTDMGPLITEGEAIRVESWVREAVDQGGHLLCGGKRDGAFYTPTVLTKVPTDCRVARDEVFGPVVSLYSVDHLEEAISEANRSDYGLQIGVFTQDLEKAFKVIQQCEAGGIMINDSTDFRIDAMPFGGVKSSGLGREGVRFSIQEMTEMKVVCFQLSNR
ncbi:aldehyde dehydrogenase family protein [Kroppenstedtia pulmonis]|uniref:Aldehyde dehydrogenase family protein n=1 Tax=Kroppenstedtia pulmonis TaxID=1380685 RepID=A0A7D4BGG6_9BACL|nr:aldehyde dehydrogenase family protein [Kroppenstedtia pulmonis]QKG85052.1 aldehyde dehydrogenase family protein [Kroppenstedtia pulmonis]